MKIFHFCYHLTSFHLMLSCFLSPFPPCTHFLDTFISISYIVRMYASGCKSFEMTTAFHISIFFPSANNNNRKNFLSVIYMLSGLGPQNVLNWVDYVAVFTTSLRSLKFSTVNMSCACDWAYTATPMNFKGLSIFFCSLLFLLLIFSHCCGTFFAIFHKERARSLVTW